MPSPSPAPPATDTLIAASRDVLGLPPECPVTLSPLAEQGSDRITWRVNPDGAPPCILTWHSGVRAENEHFAPLAKLLTAYKVRVPCILGDRPEARLLWLEDLGTRDLHSLTLDPTTRLAAYRTALDELIALHRLATATPPDDILPHLQPPFDSTLYRWEQDYFFEHLAGTHHGHPDHRIQTARSHPAMRDLANNLAERPRTLVHRDFQSRNILFPSDTGAALIDFQGIRWGVPAYDLASLLHDPYVDLAGDEVESLFTYYHRQAGTSDLAAAREEFQNAAIQRLLQALGAYGNLGHHHHKPAFLEFIPVALRRLRIVLDDHPCAAPLLPLLTPA